jgi:DnaJ-class molecular chaperone
VRLKGQGHKLTGMQRGDAVINIHIAPHDDFTVDGFDLHTVLPVTIENAVLGTDARIDGPNGPLTVTIARRGPDPTNRSALRVRDCPMARVARAIWWSNCALSCGKSPTIRSRI